MRGSGRAPFQQQQNFLPSPAFYAPPQPTFQVQSQQWPVQPHVNQHPTFTSPLQSYYESGQSLPVPIQTYHHQQQQQHNMLQQTTLQHQQQQRQQQQQQQQRHTMMQSQHSGEVQSAMGNQLVGSIGGLPTGYSQNVVHQRYHAMPQTFQQIQPNNPPQHSDISWNSPARLGQQEQNLLQPRQNLQGMPQQQHVQHQGIPQHQVHQYQQGIPQHQPYQQHHQGIISQQSLQHQRKMHHEPQKVHPQQQQQHESNEKIPVFGKPQHFSDDRGREDKKPFVPQQEKDMKEREREYRDRLNRENDIREREIRDREREVLRDKEQEKGDRVHHNRNHQVRNRKEGSERDRGIEPPVAKDRKIEPYIPTSSLSSLTTSSVLTPINAHSNSHSGKPPKYSINILERSVTDLALRYPHLSLPQTLTHCIANWIRTFPTRVNPLELSHLESASITGLESDNSSEGANLFSHRIFNSRVNRVILDNQRRSLRMNDVSSVIEESSPGSILHSPVHSLNSSNNSEKLPVKFTTRVVMLAKPQRKDGQSTNHVSFIPSEVCILLRQQSTKYQLLGGSYDVSLDNDSGNESDGPFFDDSCLIKSATRHVLSQSGINLSECTDWVKLLQINHHRPETSVIDEESDSHKVSTPEHFEVITVFIVLDLWRALRFYKVDTSSIPFWAHSKFADNENKNSHASFEENSLDSTSVPLMSVRELKLLLTQRGLDSKGRKDELVTRLLEAVKAEAHKKKEDNAHKTDGGMISSYLNSTDFEPPSGPCLLAIAPLGGATEDIHHALVSLDSLLNYTESDCATENGVEVFLVAESLLELFQRDCAVSIASAFTLMINKDKEDQVLSSEKDESSKRRKLDGGHLSGSSELKCSFRMFDREGTGVVALEDIEKAISNAGMRLSRLDTKAILESMNSNKHDTQFDYLKL